MNSLLDGALTRAGAPASSHDGIELEQLGYERASAPRSLVLSSANEIRSFAAGHTVHRAGSRAGAVFQIVTGHVKLLAPARNGGQQIVALLGAGDCFGLSDDGRNLCSAETLTPVQVRVLARGKVDSNSIHAINRQLQAQMSASFSHCVAITQLSARERLADFLTRWAKRETPQLLNGGAADAEPIELRIPLLRYEIANYLSVTTETLSRCFAEFRRRGFISTPTPKAREILRIDDFQGLLAVCSEARPEQRS
ncbi:Crp/Fnr family transcriptional regulator [Bradyrhizobium ontarionense]|uniref:Crp/Fnr family transcriptional regulator n=1 Tax=Bradyrhizobium ontarionense TaxID=2898149 RepID=A0ABY3R5X2_9BRAD|nr:Crp/Fnr family transcriptional regulator [Bradyrhizobium sp. A19]UFZ02708.1 Crp/Fnr family transcriptional regulator [Bradyrhizobium sp. A19]